jgi:phospholipid/cholesterol/gamma-HCH transport system substrate-binding protein
MENQSHAFIAGLFTLLLGAGVLLGAWWLNGPKGPKLMPVDLLTAHSVVGLKVDAPVRFRGVDVGRVESIAFDPQKSGQIRVRVGIDPASPLTTSTYAKLSYQGISGVGFIQLDDPPDAKGAPLVLSSENVAQMELEASFLERAELDARGLVLKATDVATRLDALLSEEHQARIMALVDSLGRTVDGLGSLARDIEPSAKALPSLLQETHGAVSTVTKLANDADQRLIVLDRLSLAAQQVGRATDELHRDTLPRVNALLDEVSTDARELRRTLHQANSRPQSFIFGLEPPTPGPGEHGFVDTLETAK